jgi:hypothetical protein
MSADNLYFFVDTIEGSHARLLTEDGESFAVKASSIPDGAKEGDWLLVSFEISRALTSESRREIEKLYEELGDNP